MNSRYLVDPPDWYLVASQRRTGAQEQACLTERMDGRRAGSMDEQTETVEQETMQELVERLKGQRVSVVMPAFIDATGAQQFLREVIEDQLTDDLRLQWEAFLGGYRAGMYSGMYLAEQIAAHQGDSQETEKDDAGADGDV